MITASAICREQGEPVTAAMARQLAPLKSQTVRCDAWQMKSQRHVVRIRYQLVVGVFDSSLSVRYRQDVHLKALRKEKWPH